MTYPACRRSDHQDEYHGVTIADPYRWLEDVDSVETKEWVGKQVDCYEGYMKTHCTDLRQKLNGLMTERWNFERYGCPFQRGSRVYFWYNSGLLNQSVLYAQDSGKEMTVVLDPNTLSDDGTAAVSTLSFTESGNYMAYAVSLSGSDWKQIRVMDPTTGQQLDDTLDWVKFSSISWTKSGAGFFYSRYPRPASLDDTKENRKGQETDQASCQMVYYHKVDTQQAEDVLVYAAQDHSQWMHAAQVSDCGAYLVISTSESCEPANRVAVAPLDEKHVGQLQFHLLMDSFEAEYDYITNQGTVFYFKTNKNAPNGKIVSVGVSESSSQCTDVIAHDESSQLTHALCVDTDKLVLARLKDVKESLELYSLQGNRISELLPPSILSVSAIQGKSNQSTLFYSITSFTEPGVSYKMELPDATATVFRQTTIPSFDSSLFVVKQVFYPSKDGTRIPMFLFHHRDVKLDGTNPTVLYGYGGFNIALTPYFSVIRWCFVEAFKGVFAVANLRGGAEYGDDWHHAGTRTKKQNVFDDFQYAARYLIEEKFTSPAKLAINGGSNGGLLVAACANQAPELFGCAVAQVGVMDMLRFHKFTIGYAWCSDFGNAEENKDEFEAIIKYSPLHNIQTQKPYPAMLITTADHDDRVVPLHSFKYGAELQHRAGCVPGQRPLLLRIDVKAGHGAGKPLSKTIQEYADIFAFIASSLQVTWKINA